MEKIFCPLALCTGGGVAIDRRGRSCRGSGDNVMQEQETLLNSIHSPDDLKKLTDFQLERLCGEIREELISTLSKNGGHLASNLGVVELTVALHKVFHSPTDKIVWDVGHQCYTHKLLTGRRERFCSIRKENGLSGFPRPDESVHDPVICGHSSTSISSALGLARAKTLRGESGNVIAVIGDGALTGGLAYEALNNAGRIQDNLIVILNDNKMSISKNVGAVPRSLTKMRTRPQYFRFKSRFDRFLKRIPGIGVYLSRFFFSLKNRIKWIIFPNNLFENMGFRYFGPIDGHNIKQMTDLLQMAKVIRHPVLIHVNTVKGKGYSFAELDPKIFHGISPFDVNTGEPTGKTSHFSDCFGEELCALAEHDSSVCAITAAMALGTGLVDFMNRFRDRFYDVGIAEEHAVTFAAGLAAGGMRPVFAVYSTFLQRGYDQLIHDIAIQNLHVVFAIDRAGIVGEDGETHQGVFDAAFLNAIPNITVFAPACFTELRRSLHNALYECTGAVALRYPRGGEPELPADFHFSGRGYDWYGGTKAEIVLVTYGRLFANACEAQKRLMNQGVRIRVLKLNVIKPIEESAYKEVLHARYIFFFEEGIRSGGIGEHFGSHLLELGYGGEFHIIAVEDEFIPQASVNRCLERYRLDADGMEQTVLAHIEAGGKPCRKK